MKLVEILARELKVWPCDGPATQDPDKEVRFLKQRHDFFAKELAENAGDSCGLGEKVTRAEWEAERAKLKAPKANGDGWVRNRGRSGKPPVADGVMVQVVLRNESKNNFDEKPRPAKNWDWRHRASHSDLMWYRIHKPAEQPEPVSDTFSQVNAQEPILTIRDRIYELDSMRAEVESTYQRQIREITQERESLVQKLAGEGLALVEVVVQPVEDMSDWRNWRAGDLIECIGKSGGYSKGSVYEVKGFDFSRGVVYTEIDDKGSESNGWNANMFRFVSRPTS